MWTVISIIALLFSCWLTSFIWINVGALSGIAFCVFALTALYNIDKRMKSDYFEQVLVKTGKRPIEFYYGLPNEIRRLIAPHIYTENIVTHQAYQRVLPQWKRFIDDLYNRSDVNIEDIYDKIMSLERKRQYDLVLKQQNKEAQQIEYLKNLSRRDK